MIVLAVVDGAVLVMALAVLVRLLFENIPPRGSVVGHSYDR